MQCHQLRKLEEVVTEIGLDRVLKRRAFHLAKEELSQLDRS